MHRLGLDRLELHAACRPTALRACTQRTRKARKTQSVTVQARSAPPRLFVFGLGYTGLAVADEVQKLGWDVAGTIRSGTDLSDRSSSIQQMVFRTEDKSANSAQILEHLQQANYILSTMPPCQEESLALKILRMHTDHDASQVKWIGYLSSTSVYGDWGGAWVDESCVIRPGSEKAIQRAESEAKWLSLHQGLGLPVHCFRLGGIYGPGRSALDAVQNQGQTSNSKRRRSLQQYTARCHVQDIANALLASMHHPKPGSIYNIVDDNPASRAEALDYAKQLLARRTKQDARDNTGIRLQAADSNRSDGEQSSTSTSTITNAADIFNGTAQDGPSKLGEKRVSNSKIKSELGFCFRYPSYQEGLTAVYTCSMFPSTLK